ncbi:protein YhfH [Salinibacillus xinjiangensis]|uniref:YhfH family protein n=1 Tax=Salinibacillus xinjiangensis TaxID=1229268 RepID=A0A6G1X1L0_9BACI|nr:protein YhfH [Salinibacillus xinjiangensis]MRG84718.1 YhfH family protein [Salinibacillus xinjiangensis]
MMKTNGQEKYCTECGEVIEERGLPFFNECEKCLRKVDL